MSNPFYHTGFTPDGRSLTGGVWTAYHQNGFPIEMSHLLAAQNNCLVDWCEAMADASQTDNLPSLMEQLGMFLPSEVIDRLKRSWLLLEEAPADILTRKRRFQS